MRLVVCCVWWAVPAFMRNDEGLASSTQAHQFGGRCATDTAIIEEKVMGKHGHTVSRVGHMGRIELVHGTLFAGGISCTRSQTAFLCIRTSTWNRRCF